MNLGIKPDSGERFDPFQRLETVESLELRPAPFWSSP